ncbi:MAG TPA: MFS transporter, partial [Gaiellales bacterium]|nr:MFS transporter [Gaiellales bacterium]
MDSDRYKWIALSNTTLGVLLATLDASIILIAMPSIFRGIKLDPLVPENSFYLLWMILGYLVVTSVLIVSLGRLGDMYGRVRIYNLGFVIYTAASLLLAIDWMTGTSGATYLIGFRIVQGIGGACLLANAAAIITDAFPSNQRGLALGINNIVGVSGMFVGLVLGGLLAPIDWRLVFLISVPIGLFGTVWAYLKLEERSVPRRAPIDWWGNVTFALGLGVLLTAIIYGIQPYGGHTMGWTNPWVVGGLLGGLALLAVFCVVENRVADPMFHMDLFLIRQFWTGNLAGVLGSIGRGGMQFMLIIWLQGVWLPLHGYDFESTPLWAGIYLLPLTIGFIVSGPLSGALSDRHGPRPFAVGGLLVTAVAFIGLVLLPVDFSYWAFALLLVVSGLGSGLFASPNASMIMNSVPPRQRGAASGMRMTGMNAGQALSIGIFFSLMVVGLSSSLPTALSSGLQGQGVPAVVAHQVAGIPPVG